MAAVSMNQKIAVGIVFVSAMFMNIMDITIVNVALPTIGRDFHIAPTAVDGVVIAYLVSLAVFIPASGWLGDRFGGKRVLLTAIVVFTIGSALCGVAQNMTELVVFRVIQGAGGGMMAPVGMAMLYRVFPPAERVRAASILTLGTTVAPAVGPVLGGFLVTNFSWRWVFFVNVPIGIVAVVFGALVLEKVDAIDAGRFDVPGFVLGGIGLGLLMYGISEGPLKGWSSTGVIASCVTGTALLVHLRHGGAAHQPSDGGPAPAARTAVPIDQRRDVPGRCRVLGTAVSHSALFPGRPGPQRAAVRSLHFPGGLRRDDRRAVRQPPHLPALRTAAAHHRRAAGARRLHAHPDPDQRDHEPVVHPWPHVRAGLDDGSGHGAEPGSCLRQDQSRVHGPGVHVLQHHAPGWKRHRCRRPLHRADQRRHGPQPRQHRCLPISRATASPSSRPRIFALAAAGFSLTIHDSDAAETIVRRVRRSAPARRAEIPVPEGSPA